ncbi:MAG: hypothetical protein KBF78_17230 [Fuscovulum sp.]|nr:hypothetical protein [Fuscovulum sp.]
MDTPTPEMIADALSDLLRQIGEMAEADVRPTPAERVRMIRKAADIMAHADKIAAQMCELSSVAEISRRESYLGQADEMWEAHSKAADALVVMICGDESAKSQMDAIERRCAMGGF